MVISIINGGFANQLYRYACAYATAKKYGQELIIIVQTTNVGTDPFQLGEFKIEYSELYVMENHLQKAVLLQKWKEEYRLKEVTESEYLSVMSDDLFKEYDGIILYGTYQYPVFFEEYMDDLRKMLCFEEETQFLSQFKEEIAGRQSVGVHVRRGDFLTYDALCREMEFYKAAMCVMEDQLGYGQGEYYIFSDDKEFVRSYFGRNKRIHYVQVYGDYREAVEEFFALSLCSHRILTEASSFSRMADALNAERDGYAVYENFGFSRKVSPRENLLYLDKQMVTAFAVYYTPLFERDLVPENPWLESEIPDLDLPALIKLGMDTRDVKKESEIMFRIRKIELLIDRKQYAEALGQARKLWEIAFGTKGEARMHELYQKCLYEFGYRAESMIEAAFLEDEQGKTAQYYNPSEQNLIKRLRSAAKNTEVVLVPARSFNPNEFEDMIHAGAVLRRLGYPVTFMFWEPELESEYYQPYSKTLREGNYFEDVMGHNSLCRMVNLTEQEKEFETLSAFFNSFFGDSGRAVLLAKQKKVIDAAAESIFSEKITTVYWDNTNIFDMGSYKGLIPQDCGFSFYWQEITEEEKKECYECADYCITFDESLRMDKPLVLLKEDWQQFLNPKQSRLVADFYRISPIMIENVFEIILHIINRRQEDDERGKME